MISKRIDREPENDNYRGLATYIMDARPTQREHGRTAAYIADMEHQGEKVLHLWHAGCLADSYELAIKEVEATQDLNRRTRREKTYHLLVSFRPEDEPQLTEEVFKEIELAFAKALGFEEHQRHCGVHKNTANVHMHVAYNMIHPLTLNRQEPYRDYLVRDKLCRELELKYGLSVDNGRTQGSPKRENEKAKIVEAHTRQQSFDGYCQERKDVITVAVAKAARWEDVHMAMAELGLEIVLHGNGCTIKDRHGKHAIKASSLDRGLSKAQLVKRFGPYVGQGQHLEQVEEKSRYDAKPLQRGPERAGLWKEYQAGILVRKKEGEAIRQEQEANYAAVADKWDQERKLIMANEAPLAEKRKQLQEARTTEKKERQEVQRSCVERKTDLRTRIPFWSWAGFLQMKAEQGHEVALAILRSNEKEAEPEMPGKDGPDARAVLREAAAEERVPPATEDRPNTTSQEKQPSQENLRGLFDEAMLQRSEQLDAILREHDAVSNEIRLRWSAQRREAERLSKADRFTRLSAIARHERKELKDAREPFDVRREEVQARYPFATWAEFLALRNGDIDGSKMSRVKQAISVDKEREAANAARVAFREKWQNKRDIIRDMLGLVHRDRKRLMSVSRFEQLAQEEQEFPRLQRERIFTGYTYTVDARGTVLVKLTSGGMVRDTGPELSYSGHDPRAHEAARHVARMKFGRFASQDGTKFLKSILTKELVEKYAKDGQELAGEVFALKQELPTAFPAREKMVKETIKQLKKAGTLPASEQAEALKKHMEWLSDEAAGCPKAEKEIWRARANSLKRVVRQLDTSRDRHATISAVRD